MAFGRWGTVNLNAPLGRRNTAVGFNIPFEWPFDDESETGVERGHRMQVDEVASLNSHTGEMTCEFWLQPINRWAGTVIARNAENVADNIFRCGVELREVEGKQENVLVYEFSGEGNGGRSGLRTMIDLLCCPRPVDARGYPLWRRQAQLDHQRRAGR